MSKLHAVAFGLLAAAAITGARADDFPVVSHDVSGKPGKTVDLKLTYDYGPSFVVTTEDLKMKYESPGLSWLYDLTFYEKPNPDTCPQPCQTQTQELAKRVADLRTLATGHSGGLLENTTPVLDSGFKGYALSFYTADGVGDERTGQVNLHAMFKIASDAQPGQRFLVSFEGSMLADPCCQEYTYPEALYKLYVNVVPEPAIAWLLLPGIALVAARSRRSAKQAS